MYKDLLVTLTDTDGDANALAYAVELASRHEAHLTLLQTVEPVAGHPWGLSTDAAMAGVEERTRATAGKEAARWRSQLEGESIASELRVVESATFSPAQTAARLARHKDINVMSGSKPDSNRDWLYVHGFFSEALLGSGRPVLVVPPGFEDRAPIRHVVVAWKPTREATRALHDAMPILHAAESVDLLELDPEPDQQDSDRQPIEDLATHLARHGLKVHLLTKERKAQSVASALLSHAGDSRADLLVAGGYGHSRLREWTLGGATRDLLRHGTLPLLFSH